MALLRWLCCTVCLLGLVIPSLNCSSSPKEEANPLEGLGCYLVQMHIHGHTNHNGNDLPASMESHCAEGERAGFDVIWWTDHARLFEAYDDDIKIDFRDAYVDTATGAIVFKAGRARDLTRLNVNMSGDGCRIEIEDGSLVVTVESSPDSLYGATAMLSLGSDRGKVHTVDFCRPVTSHLRFRAWCDVENLTENTGLTFGFDYSLHPGGQHHSRHTLAESTPGPPTVIGDTTVNWETGYVHPEDMISIDLAQSVGPLPNGLDNTLSTAWIEVSARHGETISVRLDSLSFTSTEPAADNQYETVDALTRTYRAQYGIIQYTGVEIGLLHTPRLPHMNAYFPDSTQSLKSVGLGRSMRRDLWVDMVHRRGGLVSLNHPFGASLQPRRGRGEPYPPGMSARMIRQEGASADEADFWEYAGPIIEDDGLGADILEVGYLFRGLGSLEDHLLLWDLALANGVKLVGNGVSDSHGGIWGPDMVPNPFASWIWADSTGADDLLEALRAGHVAFGDPFNWHGEFAFGVDSTMMGDTLFTGVDPVTGWIHMEPWRNDIEIKLIQVEIAKGRELKVLRNESVEYAEPGIEIDIESPSFVRMEIYRNDGTPLVFSNPVFLIPR
jgi:hypothetical protein